MATSVTVATPEFVTLPEKELLQLDDFVYSYPSVDDPLIQSKITSKEEFNELAAPLKESVPEQGGFFNSQKFIHRIMQVLDEVVVIHRAGTGKTGAAVGTTQLYKGASVQSRADFITRYYMANADHIKHVYVLVKGKILRESFIKQLVCQFSDKDEYFTEHVLNGKNENTRKRRLYDEVKTFYTILTYGGFAKLTVNAQQKSRSDRELREMFSDCAFIIDEFHNVGKSSSETRDEANARFEAGLIDQKQDDNDDTEDNDTDDDGSPGVQSTVPTTSMIQPTAITPTMVTGSKPKRKRKSQLSAVRVYEQIQKVFQVAKRRKIIALSATPMIDRVDQLRVPMNLILPPGKRIPDSLDLNTAGIEDLEPYFRGRISYVREIESEVKVVYMAKEPGEVVNDVTQSIQDPAMRTPSITTPHIVERDGVSTELYSQLKLWKVPMVKQYQAYQLNSDGQYVLGTFPGQDVYYQQAMETSQRFRLKERQAGTAVFPDGSYDSSGSRKFIRPSKGTASQNPFVAIPEYQVLLQQTSYLQGTSAVNYEIMKVINNTPGNALITSDFVRGAAGVVNTGLTFQANGWSIFTGSEKVFSNIFTQESEQTVSNYRNQFCRGRKKTTKMRQLNISRWVYGVAPGSPDPGSYLGVTGPPRFAIIMTENEKYHNSILRVFNSPENMHGEIIRLLIVSPVGQEGINTANVVQIFKSTPGWTISGTYQGISRGIRATSHDDLIAEQRALKIAAGEDPDTAEVTVRIYLMAAVRADFSPAVAEPVYFDAEEKDIKIKRIERFLKQVSLDCYIHRMRNMRPSDNPFSIECDYMGVCKYECYPPVDGPFIMDSSSYDLLYADDVIADITQEIILIFMMRSMILFDQLYLLLDGYRKKLINFALERMITDRTVIRDRVGRNVYLAEDGAILFLTESLIDNVPVSYDIPITDYSLSIYERMLQSTRTAKLSQVVESMTMSKQEPLIAQLNTTQPFWVIGGVRYPDTTFKQILDSLTVDNQIRLFEETVHRVYPNIASGVADRDEAIITHFQDNFFIFIQDAQLSQELSRQARIQSTKKKGQGRRSASAIAEMSRPGPSNQFEDSNTITEVYLHTMYVRVKRGASFGIMARNVKRKIRLFKIYYQKMPDGSHGPMISKDDWRDANSYESEVYNNRITAQVQQEQQRLVAAGNGVYGIYSHIDNKFRVVDRRINPEATGVKCDTLSVPQLIEYMWHFRVEPAQNSADLTRDQLVGQLLEINSQYRNEQITNEQLWPEDRVRFYYNWYTQNTVRDDLCVRLQQDMQGKGLITTRAM